MQKTRSNVQIGKDSEDLALLCSSTAFHCKRCLQAVHPPVQQAATEQSKGARNCKSAWPPSTPGMPGTSNIRKCRVVELNLWLMARNITSETIWNCWVLLRKILEMQKVSTHGSHCKQARVYFPFLLSLSQALNNLSALFILSIVLRAKCDIKIYLIKFPKPPGKQWKVSTWEEGGKHSHGMKFEALFQVFLF